MVTNLGTLPRCEGSLRIHLGMYLSGLLNCLTLHHADTVQRTNPRYPLAEIYEVIHFMEELSLPPVCTGKSLLYDQHLEFETGKSAHVSGHSTNRCVNAQLNTVHRIQILAMVATPVLPSGLGLASS